MYQQGNLFDSVPPASDPEPEKKTAKTAAAEPKVYTVGELTRILKRVISKDPVLGDRIVLRGEVSNLKQSSRGHVYFSLKDDEASINGVIWASTVARLSFELEDGLEVFVTGSLDIYAPNGTYSIVTKKIEPVGMGALQLAYLQIKEKLEKEGLFDPAHKKPIPEFPRRIGIVTSRTGAVIHDMLRVIKRKNPMVNVLLAPVAVQGPGAALEIASAIEALNSPDLNLDLLIVGRGGGSFEDLFCFSEEPVVRAVFNSQVPIITGIGHEPDYALADAAADVSCSTPTAAAERAVPDYRQLVMEFYRQRENLLEQMAGTILLHEQAIDQRATRMIELFSHTLHEANHKLVSLRERLLGEGEKTIQRFEQHLAKAASELDAYNPLTTLARGYALASGPDGKMLRSIKQVKPQDKIRIMVSDGEIDAEVRDIQPKTYGSKEDDHGKNRK